MRVLILGGTGFIGSALAALLLRRGATVIVPSRTPERYVGRQKSERYTLKAWNGASVDVLASLVSGTSAVVNLLGENIASGRWTPALKERIVRSRLDVGRCLVEAVRLAEHRPDVCIQASAVGYYGGWDDAFNAPVCTETAPAGTTFLAQMAAAWEASTLELEALGLRRCILRTAPVLGRGGLLGRLVPLYRWCLGGVVGSGRQPFPWIHVRDAAEAIAFLLTHSKCHGAFNLAAPEMVTMRQFSQTLAAAVQRPALLPMPAMLARLLLGDMAEALLLTGQKAVPEHLDEQGFFFRLPTLHEALRESLRHW